LIKQDAEVKPDHTWFSAALFHKLLELGWFFDQMRLSSRPNTGFDNSYVNWWKESASVLSLSTKPLSVKVGRCGVVSHCFLEPPNSKKIQLRVWNDSLALVVFMEMVFSEVSL
jgi:hypothetical protein